MTDKTLDKRLLTYFHALAQHEQMSVLNYLEILSMKGQPSNEKILSLVGSISVEDLKIMEDAIKVGCNNIDSGKW